MSSDDLYALKWGQDEVALEPTSCKQPGQCTCDRDLMILGNCGYTVKQARAFVAAYYRNRADYVEKLTDAEFLHDMAGIYPD